MRAVLDRFRQYLSFFIHRGERNWRATLLRAHIHELEQEENADIMASNISGSSAVH